MAKISIVQREIKRSKLVARYSEKRAALRSIIKDINAPDNEKWKASFKLQSLPRDSSRSRQRNRCQVTGRSHGFYRCIKRGGKIWIRIFPDKPITQKPLEVRQGKGKGNVEYWAAQVQPGRMLYEIEGVPEELARQALVLAAAKLPLSTIFVIRTVI